MESFLKENVNFYMIRLLHF